jgi:hypothetical protein
MRRGDAGDHDRARTLYTALVAADSGDARALHRLGLLLGWNGEYDRAIPLLHGPAGAAGAIHRGTDGPGERARVGPAVRRSAGGTGRAAAGRPVLQQCCMPGRGSCPGPGAYDEAEAAYRAAGGGPVGRGIAARPGPRHELARRPGAGEQLWRRAVAADPDNADARIGLSQVLRWSGRNRAALEEAQAAARAWPGGPRRAGAARLGRGSRSRRASRRRFARNRTPMTTGCSRRRSTPAPGWARAWR